MRTLKKTLALVLVLAMMFSLCVTASADFTDAEEITNAKAVAVLTGLGVIEGMPDGTFDPAGTLTRAQAAKIVAYLMGVGEYAAEPAETEFSDVPASHWASGYIAYCADKGILAGYGDGKFGPSDTLTGYAWSKMLLAALGYDAETEGLVGTAWQVNTAALAVKNGLWLGDESGAAKTAGISRDTACLYAYNLLDADTVGYSVVNIQGETALVYGRDFDLTYLAMNVEDDSDYTDEYGRPIDAVLGLPTKANAKPVSLYAEYYAPILTYTAPVLREKVLKDLGDTQTDAKFTVYVDGEKKAADKPFKADELKDEWSVSGNGVLVEIYDNSDLDAKNGNEYLVVVIPTYVTKVTDGMIIEAKAETLTAAAVKGGITIDGMFYETSDYAKKDGVEEVVAYTIGVDKDGKACIASLETLEGTEVKVTSKIGSTSFNVGETKYQYSKNWGGDVVAVNAKMNIYVDAYGYVIYSANIEEPKDTYTWNYGYMTDYAQQKYVPAGQELIGAKDAIEAAEKFEIVTAEGEKVVFDGALEVKKSGQTYTTKFVYENYVAPSEDVEGSATEGLVMYSLDEEGKIDAIKLADFTDGEGAKAVTYKWGAVPSGASFENGSAVINGVSTGVRVTADTLFIYAGENGKYAVATGYKNAADFTDSAAAYIVADGKYMAVYVGDGADTVAPEKDYIFFADVTAIEDTALDKDGEEISVFKYTGYVGTETKTLTFAKEQTLTTGLYTFTEDKGYASVEAVTAVAADADKVTAVEATYLKTEAGFEYFTSATVFYVYDADAKTITVAEGIAASDKDNTVELEYVVDFVNGADAGKAAVVYYTVTPVEG